MKKSKKNKRIKPIKEFTECTLRNILGFDCQENYLEIEREKVRNSTGRQVYGDYIGQTILNELGIFPEIDFLVLEIENEELDKKLDSIAIKY